MAFNLGDIIVTIKANTDSLKSGLKDVENFTDKTSKGVEGLNNYASGVEAFAKKAVVGIGIASAAAGAFGVVSVKAFADSEDRIAQTNAVLKSTGQIAGVTADQVTKLAQSLQNQTRYSDEDVRSVENLLLTFTSIGKDIFPQATKTVLDMATALKEDTSSASIQLGKALQDPILGVTALRRVGVNFNESQQEVIKNLVNTGQSAKAQQLILAELNKEFGGSAVAAGQTFAGKLTILKNKLNDVEESIGGVIVDALTPLANKLTNFVTSDKFSAWADKAGKAVSEGLTKSIQYFTANILPKLITLFETTVKVGSSLLNFYEHHRGLVTFLAQTLLSMAAAFYVVAKAVQTVNAVVKIWNLLAETNPWLLLITAIIAATILIITHWKTVKQWFSDFWNFMKEIFNDAISWIKDHWLLLMGLLLGPFGLFVGEVIKHWQDILNFVTGVFSAIYNAAVGVWQAIYRDAISPFFNFVVTVFTYLWHFIDFIWQTIAAITVFVWQQIYQAAIKPIIDFIVQDFQNIWSWIVYIWSVVSAATVAAWQFIYNVAIKPIIDAVVAAMNWVAGVAQSVWNAVSGAARGAWNVIVSVWQGAIGWFQNIWDHLTGGARGAASGVGGFFSGIWDNIKNVFKSGLNFVIDILNHMVNAYNKTVGKIPGAPHIANLDRFARGTENFAGGGAIVGEEGSELALFPSGTKVVPHNLTASLVDNLMSVGDMLSSFMHSGVGSLLPANRMSLAGAGGGGNKTITTNINGDIHINSPQDADYFFKRFDRNVELEDMGLSTNE